jgi:hypothetical protein
LELPEESVKFRVGDLGGVENVVEIVVVDHLFPQLDGSPPDLPGDGLLGHLGS